MTKEKIVQDLKDVMNVLTDEAFEVYPNINQAHEYVNASNKLFDIMNYLEKTLK